MILTEHLEKHFLQKSLEILLLEVTTINMFPFFFYV